MNTDRPQTASEVDSMTPLDGQEAASSKQEEASATKQQQYCRICRKHLASGSPTLSSEPVHLCSNCQQLICDDCASYSVTDKVSFGLPMCSYYTQLPNRVDYLRAGIGQRIDLLIGDSLSNSNAS